jgi:hypothetical protein
MNPRASDDDHTLAALDARCAAFITSPFACALAESFKC